VNRVRAAGLTVVDYTPVCWSLVFEFGEIESTSFISVENGCAATLAADTTMNLVRQTADELHKHAGEEVEAAA
jgi:hypothetical protein